MVAGAAVIVVLLGILALLIVLVGAASQQGSALLSAVLFATAGVLMIVFRERFVEWVANRNRKFGIVNRHDTAARRTAWFIGITFIAVGCIGAAIALGIR